MFVVPRWVARLIMMGSGLLIGLWLVLLAVIGLALLPFMAAIPLGAVSKNLPAGSTIDVVGVMVIVVGYFYLLLYRIGWGHRAEVVDYGLRAVRSYWSILGRIVDF